MSRASFDELADALRGFLPPRLRAFEARTSARNLKVWFGEDAHEHYEAQVISAAALRAGGVRAGGVRGGGPALEVGFHAEHLDPARNAEVLARITALERSWRRRLRDAEAGPFVGRARGWARVSELWFDCDLGDDGTLIEAAERLAAYIEAFEPLRREGG